MTVSMILRVGCLALVLSLAACGQGSVHSSAPPGTPIVSFLTSPDETLNTVLYSNPDAIQAGIDGRVLTVREYQLQKPLADELTVDLDGNLGLRGAIYIRSSRKEKTNIEPYDADALDVLSRVSIVSYRYRNEHQSQAHIGMIAEDVPSELAGPRRQSVNVLNTLAIDVAATKELNNEVTELRREVASLHRQIQAIERKR